MEIKSAHPAVCPPGEPGGLGTRPGASTREPPLLGDGYRAGRSLPPAHQAREAASCRSEMGRGSSAALPHTEQLAGRDQGGAGHCWGAPGAQERPGKWCTRKVMSHQTRFWFQPSRAMGGRGGYGWGLGKMRCPRRWTADVGCRSSM